MTERPPSLPVASAPAAFPPVADVVTQPYDWDPTVNGGEGDWVCQMHGIQSCAQDPECIANQPAPGTAPPPEPWTYPDWYVAAGGAS